jgi:hypothetical protein
MHHPPPHGPASWIVLLLIPLVIWLRLRRTGRAARTQDLWFEPEGDHFIYHPFGRLGAAYLISAGTRDAIRAQLARFRRAAGVVVIAAAVGPMVLMSANPVLYWQWRPFMMAIRLGMILLLIPLGLLWHMATVRPLYAGAAPAPRRISMQDFRARQAASRSWWSIGIGFPVLSVLAAVMLYSAFVHGSTASGVYGAVLLVLALVNLRALMTKIRLRRSEA